MAGSENDNSIPLTERIGGTPNTSVDTTNATSADVHVDASAPAEDCPYPHQLSDDEVLLHLINNDEISPYVHSLQNQLDGISGAQQGHPTLYGESAMQTEAARLEGIIENKIEELEREYTEIRELACWYYNAWKNDPNNQHRFQNSPSERKLLALKTGNNVVAPSEAVSATFTGMGKVLLMEAVSSAIGAGVVKVVGKTVQFFARTKAGRLVQVGAKQLSRKLAQRLERNSVAIKKIMERRRAAKRSDRTTGGGGAPKGCKACASGPNPTLLVQGKQNFIDASFPVPGLMGFEVISHFEAELGVKTAYGCNRISEFDATLVRDGRKLSYLDEGCFPTSFPVPTPNPEHWVEDDVVRPLKLSAGPKRSYLLWDRSRLKTFHKFSDGVWRIVRVEDKSGNALNLERGKDGALLSITTPENLKIRFSYKGSLRIAADLVGADGTEKRVMNWDYDDQGNMTLSESPYGERLVYGYDEQGRLNQLNRNGDYDARYSHDEKGRAVRYDTNYFHDGTRFVYDDVRRITTYVPGGEQGQAERVYYTEDQKIFMEVNALGHIRYTEENEYGYTEKETDAEGNSVSYTYDQDGNIKSIADAEGRETFYFWDEDRNLEILIDPEGNSYDFEYDERGNLSAVKDPLGFRTDIKNNSFGQPLGIMRHDGLIQFNGYDEYRRLISVTDFRGGKTCLQRDAFGRITEITNPAGTSTKLYYEDQPGHSFWQASSIIRSDGAVSKLDVPDRLTKITTDAEGRKTVTRLDGRDNIREVEGPTGDKIVFHYDKLERLLEVENQKGLRWRFERDGAGRVVRETDFDDRTLIYEYDNADRVVRKTNADGSYLTYVYDKSGLLTELKGYAADTSEPDEAVTYGYDDRGLLLSAISRHSKVEFERDEAGQIIAEICDGQRIESAFDCCGRRESRSIAGETVGFTYDPLGELLTIQIGDHKPLEFERDILGQELVRKSASGFQLTQDWDSEGQVLRQKSGSPGQGLAAAGNIDRRYLWSKTYEPIAIDDSRWGALSYGYDKNGQIVETRYGDKARERFQYDVALNITAVGVLGKATEQRGDGKPGNNPQSGTTIRVSDYRNRASASVPEAEQFLNWQSSKGGRVSSAVGPNGEKVTLTHDVQGRVVERRVDRNGFRPVLLRLFWNSLDQLTEVRSPDGSGWRYGYDAFGRRVFKERIERPANDEQTSHAEHAVQRVEYLWDGDVVAEERKIGPNGQVSATQWYFEPQSFRPLAKRTGSQLWYVVNDHLGTPRELLSEDGHLVWAAEYTTWGHIRRLWQAANDDSDPERGAFQGYDSAGQPVYTTRVSNQTQGNLALKATPNPDPTFCPIRFQGQWQDEETGLHYNRFRYYDNLASQYVSPDPIGIFGGARPNGYVELPSLYVDPWGLTTLYRNLRADEDPCSQGGIHPKAPSRVNITPEGHVLNASKSTFKGSPYISTTKSLDVADKWREPGQRTVAIDSSKLGSDKAVSGYDKTIDVSKGCCLKGATSKNWAKASQEVLVNGSIPCAAIMGFVR